MSSNKMIVRRIAWISVVLQFLLIVILAAIFHIYLCVDIAGFACNIPECVMEVYFQTFITPYMDALNLALCFYLGAFILLRNLVPRNHRKAIHAYKAGDYLQAIAEFDKSYAFFMRHPWIDRYRFLLLLSSSRLSYTEMALVNAAFCHAQAGNGPKAVEYILPAVKLLQTGEVPSSSIIIRPGQTGYLFPCRIRTD